MAQKKASSGPKSSGKKKGSARENESRRTTGQSRASQDVRVPAGQKKRSQGRYPGSTPTADDEMKRGTTRIARGQKTAPPRGKRAR